MRKKYNKNSIELKPYLKGGHSLETSIALFELEKKRAKENKRKRPYNVIWENGKRKKVYFTKKEVLEKNELLKKYNNGCFDYSQYKDCL